MKDQHAKQTIKSGYPVKEYTFTGNWIPMEQGMRKARRNRDTVFAPEYKSGDGDLLLDMTQSYKQS